jgi:hypothetical protein
MSNKISDSEVEKLIEKLLTTKEGKYLAELNRNGILVAFLDSGIRWERPFS